MMVTYQDINELARTKCSQECEGVMTPCQHHLEAAFHELVQQPLARVHALSHMGISGTSPRHQLARIIDIIEEVPRGRA